MKAQTKQRGRPTLHSLKILKEAKKKITDKKDLVKILEDSKKNVPEEKKDAAAAKKNILNKTRRR